jgi:hypothetical protein
MAEKQEPVAVRLAPVEAPAVIELKPEPVQLLGAGTPAAIDTAPALQEIPQPVRTTALAAVPEPVAEEIPHVQAAPVAMEPVPVTAAGPPPEVEPNLTEPAAAKPAEPETVAEDIPAVEAAAKPEPVAEEIPHVAAAPAVPATVARKAAEAEPVAEQVPLVEDTSVAETAVAAEAVVERITHVEAAPVAPEPVVQKAVEPEPVAEAAPVVETAVTPEPVVEEIPHSEAAPVATELPVETAVDPEPVAEHVQQVEPAAELEPDAEEVPQFEVAPVATEPVVATSAGIETSVAHVPQVETVAEKEPVGKEIPHIEAVPAAVEPVAATAAEPEPVAEHIPHVETPAEAELVAGHIASVATEPQTVAMEPEAPEVLTLAEETACSTTDAHLAEVPALAAPPVAPPAAVADLKPAAPEPESPIKLHDVPDPLFALAVEIRAVQAARAAALAAPREPEQPDSSGLLELAGVVGMQPAPIQQAEPVEHSSPVGHAEPVAPAASAPEHVHATEAAVAAVEASAAVALLAPPEPEKTLILEPVALAPVPQPPAPQPTAAPGPLPQLQPVALVHTDPDGLTLPFAPMQDYTPATSRSIMPVPPRQQILAADSGPRITLPGPTLPPELTRLQDANVLTVIGEQTAQRTKEALPPAKTSGAPGWLVSALVMIVLLAAGLAVVYFLLLPRTVADAKPAPTPAVAATGPVPTGGNSPLAKFVEVTGFRIVTSSADTTKKAEVQYLVVNHSDADISDANVFITLHSAKPGQAPLCRFSFKIPSLGPFEAKEMSSPIEKSAQGISLPDWQDVRAEVQISQ